MSLKKLLVIGLVICLAVSIGLTGCGSKKAADDGKDGGKEVTKAALLTSGPVNDGGWNTSAYNGLLALEERGYEISYTENVKQDDQVAVLRDYAKKGYNLIIGHGFEYGDALTTVAKEFPDVYFAQVGGSAGGVAPNLTSGVFRTGELGYVLGRLAGELSESKKIGFVGAMEIPTIVDEVSFIEATAAKYYSGTTVTKAYTGSWVDIAAGKEAAKAMIAGGVDVIIGIGDACDAGAIQACQEADKKIWFIGWSGDMNPLAPEIVATSGVQSVEKLIAIFADQMEAGEDGINGVYGIKEGVQPLGTWAPGVPAEVKDLVVAEHQKFIDGEYTRDSVKDMIGAKSEMTYDM